MAYAVEFMPEIFTYLHGLSDVSAQAIDGLIQGVEAELGEHAEKFYATDPGTPGSPHFNYEVPVGDGVTQYLFRFVVTMQFAAQGVIRVEYADHEIIGTIEPG